MSIQTNQYLIYGLNVPVKWIKQWDKENPSKEWGGTFEKYMDDSAYKKGVKHRNGIFALYDGMGGKYLIVGKVYDKSAEGEMLGDRGPISFDKPPKEDIAAISESIKINFGLDGELKWYLVTHYR